MDPTDRRTNFLLKRELWHSPRKFPTCVPEQLSWITIYAVKILIRWKFQNFSTNAARIKALSESVSPRPAKKDRALPSAHDQRRCSFCRRPSALLVPCRGGTCLFVLLNSGGPEGLGWTRRNPRQSCFAGTNYRVRTTRAAARPAERSFLAMVTLASRLGFRVYACVLSRGRLPIVRLRTLSACSLRAYALVFCRRQLPSAHDPRRRRRCSSRRAEFFGDGDACVAARLQSLRLRS